MGIVFLFIGIAAIAIGVRGQAPAAGKLLASEFTGPASFMEWLAAILILGVIGFYKPVRPAANAMLGLVILAIFLRKGVGFFDQINKALTSATASPRPSQAAAPGGGGSPSGSGAGDAASGFGDWVGQIFGNMQPGLSGGTAIGAGAGSALGSQPSSVPAVPSLNFPSAGVI